MQPDMAVPYRGDVFVDLDFLCILAGIEFVAAPARFIPRWRLVFQMFRHLGFGLCYHLAKRALFDPNGTD